MDRNEVDPVEAALAIAAVHDMGSDDDDGSDHVPGYVSCDHDMAWDPTDGSDVCILCGLHGGYSLDRRDYTRVCADDTRGCPAPLRSGRRMYAEGSHPYERISYHHECVRLENGSEPRIADADWRVIALVAGIFFWWTGSSPSCIDDHGAVVRDILRLVDTLVGREPVRKRPRKRKRTRSKRTFVKVYGERYRTIQRGLNPDWDWVRMPAELYELFEMWMLWEIGAFERARRAGKFPYQRHNLERSVLVYFFLVEAEQTFPGKFNPAPTWYIGRAWRHYTPPPPSPVPSITNPKTYRRSPKRAWPPHKVYRAIQEHTGPCALDRTVVCSDGAVDPKTVQRRLQYESVGLHERYTKQHNARVGSDGGLYIGGGIFRRRRRLGQHQEHLLLSQQEGGARSTACHPKGEV